MHRRAATFPAALMLILASCGGSGKGNNASSAAPLKDLHDPKLAATATVPSVLPTPIAANSVPVGSVVRGSAQPDTYVVKPGDTLGAIAAQLNVSVDDLAKANGITDPARIQVGQPLKVPKAGAAATTPGPGGTPGLSGQPPLSTVAPGPTATGSVSIPATGGAPTGGGAPGAATTAAGAPAPGASPAAGAATEHTVKPGETACTIARANDISIAELAAANNQTKAQIANLKIDQLLKVPPKSGNRDC